MNKRSIQDLRNLYPGQTLNVIGRGPSILRLRAKDIGAGPVLTMSYAIQAVEALSLSAPLYSLQKVSWNRETSAPIIAHSQESLTAYATQFEQHTGIVYSFDNPADFGIQVTMPSVIVCVYIAALMGCAAVRAYCCDSITTGDQRSYENGFIRPVNQFDTYTSNAMVAEKHARALGIKLEWINILKKKTTAPATTRKILLFCPTYSIDGVEQMRPETKKSIDEIIAPDNTRVDVVIGRDNPYPDGHHQNTLHQYQVARQKVLDEGYDALFTVEHDMVVPPNALLKLDETDAQVVYALYMLRDHGTSNAPEGTVLNAFQLMPVNPTIGSSLSLYPDELTRARKMTQVPVSGCGFGCTLIRRETLEKLPFHKSDVDSYAPDWGFALDCQKKKIKQICRFDVECGHIERGVILWPFAKQQPYKVTPLATMWVNDRGTSKHMTKGVECIMNFDTAVEMQRAGYVEISQ